MSNLATSSSAHTREEPTSKSGFQAGVGSLQVAAGGAVGGLKAATGGVLEFLGFHLTKGAVQVSKVKETRQQIARITTNVETVKGEVTTAKVAILAAVGLYGFCTVGSLLKNIFGWGSGGGNGRDGSGEERQLVFVVVPQHPQE